MQLFPRLKKFEWFILLVIILTYLLLNLTNLTKLPIFVDEALYLRWSQIAGSDPSWRFISLTDGKQPLYVWLVIPFLRLIEDPLAAGRAASVFSGFFALLGMGYLGYLLGNKKTALFAMLLTLLSPYLFFYNRFGVMEATLIAGIIWTTNFAVLLARYPRLDLAMILGIVTGLTLLVKSSALFFCLMIPFSYLLVVNYRQIWTKKTLEYLMLVAVAWLFAFVIYNVQRLSPWMHMIGQKNAFFTVPYSEILEEPKRITNNFVDVWRWQIIYTTIPVLLISLYGLFRLIKTNVRTALLLSAWLMGPILGTILIARLFAPRYIVFATPFILLFAALALGSLKNFRRSAVIASLALLLPLSLIIRLHLDPINYPYASLDEGYVNGWSGGNGTKQIAEWALTQASSTGQPLKIYTEGTFGILPHGLELYVDQKSNLITIEGVYPLDQIPPQKILDYAKTNPETYLIINNTLLDTVPDTLELISQYEKREPQYSMRLYRVVPKP
jgi:4-amino-4-deoxy-L-arabinose transferase-like glycosyltransferase